MRHPITAAILAFIPLIASPCLSAQPPPREWSETTHNFEGKLVMVRMRTTASVGRFTDGYLDRVKIRRFGDVAFLVGSIAAPATTSAKPDDRDPVIWLPLAEVAELAEFKGWNSVGTYLQKEPELPAQLDSDRTPTEDASVPSITTVHRRFRIPFLIGALPPAWAENLLLFRSQDEGKTWRPVAESRVSESSFTVSVEKDGLNWFAVQWIGKDGRTWPEKPELLKPVIKVTVKTEANSPSK